MAQNLPLARGWKRRVKSSVLHILALGTTACPHQLEPRARHSVAGINLCLFQRHTMPLSMGQEAFDQYTAPMASRGANS